MKVDIKDLQDQLDSRFIGDYKVLPKHERDVSGFYLLGDVLTRTVIKYVTLYTKYELRNIKPTEDGRVSAFFEDVS